MISARITNAASGEVVHTGEFATIEQAGSWADAMIAGDPRRLYLDFAPPAQHVEPVYYDAYRVVGYNTAGGVSLTVRCELETLEAAHDEVMSAAGTKHAITMGPMRDRRQP